MQRLSNLEHWNKDRTIPFEEQCPAMCLIHQSYGKNTDKNKKLLAQMQITSKIGQNLKSKDIDNQLHICSTLYLCKVCLHSKDYAQSLHDPTQ